MRTLALGAPLASAHHPHYVYAHGHPRPMLSSAHHPQVFAFAPHPKQHYYHHGMTNRSPLDDWQYGVQSSFDAPSPPPRPVGQPLLNADQLSMFEDLFDHVGANMMPAVNAEVFAQDDGLYWAGEPAPELHHPHAGGYYTTSGVEPIPAEMPHLDFNPFDGAHGLMQRRDGVPTHSPAGVLLNFGTDTNFAPNGYHPPPVLMDKDTEIRAKVLTAIKPDSAATTAGNSPTVKYEEPSETGSATSTPTPPPVLGKRRAEDPAMSQSRKRASQKPSQQKRDNLSEEQKRENHIQSEQKRRNLIRQGFEELCALVPELNAGGYSKSAVLVHAANYLDDLKKGNQQLRHYLSQLEGRAY